LPPGFSAPIPGIETLLPGTSLLASTVATASPLASPALLLPVAISLIGLAFGLSVLFSNLVRKLAPRVDFVDRPGGHKGHRIPTPLGGGIAIWLTTILILAGGALIAATLGPSLPDPLDHLTAGALLRLGDLVEILGLATVIMLMGLLDDLKNLNWKLRLAIQVGCAVTLAVTGIRITLFGPFTHPVVGGTVTVFWIVGLTNSFNMLDNMDGLAASVGLIVALLFAGAQIAVHTLFVPAVLLVLAGALGGFLVFNRAPARLFMGDAGSNFLGFLLGALTVVGTFTRTGESSPYSVLAPLIVMAVPLYDMSSVILIRLREGRSPFVGDRRHFSHRLVARGLTPPLAVLTIDLVTLASGLGALLLHRLDGQAAFVVIAQTLSVLGVVAILERSAPHAEPSL
jgi:UDP-GlcNAc:undecaprenyl-phosphate GlcNAc-1-phosphate transferase